MKISMIAAVAKNRVIGKDNDLVWHLPDDMKFFMNKTSGHHVIMGRKNFESIPEKFRPLPNRTNIIITRQTNYNIKNCIIVNSLEDAIQIAQENGEKEAFIIGGGEIYAMGLDVADTMYITEINENFEGDTYFPEFDRTHWNEVERVHHTSDNRHEFSFDFVNYQRK